MPCCCVCAIFRRDEGVLRACLPPAAKGAEAAQLLRQPAEAARRPCTLQTASCAPIARHVHGRRRRWP